VLRAAFYLEGERLIPRYLPGVQTGSLRRQYEWWVAHGLKFDSVVNSRHACESGYPESCIILKTLDSCLRGNDETGAFLSFCDAIKFNAAEGNRAAAPTTMAAVVPLPAVLILYKVGR
jgi:hypothetical protein